MKQKVTMEQIARELGLSRLTVSSIINDKAKQRGISQATVTRVRDHLRERGYVPSRQARQLRSGATECVGILHCGRLYSHLTEAFNRLVDSVTDSPQQLEIMVVPRDRVTTGVQELLSRGVSRLVWLHSQGPETELHDPTVLNYLKHVKTAIYNFYFGAPQAEKQLLKRGIHLVGVDRFQGMRKTAELLKRFAHRRVALPESATGTPVQASYTAAFAEQGIVAIGCGQARQRGGDVVTQAKAAIPRIVKAMKEEKITVACFRDDELAGHTMALLQAKGIRVPEDLSITGFDGMSFASAFQPSLTTVKMPIEKMVKQVQTILANGPKKKRHCFELELVKGKSVGRAKKS